MSKDREYLKLLLKGLPKSYLGISWEDSNLSSFSRFQRFITSLRDGTVVYAYNDNGQVISRIIDDELYGAKDIKFIDFADYFRESFNSNDKVPVSKLMYVYNIGNEEVRDYTFSDKKLYNIIQTNLQNGGLVILSSNTFTHTTFKRNYPTSSSTVENNQQILKEER